MAIIKIKSRVSGLGTLPSELYVIVSHHTALHHNINYCRNWYFEFIIYQKPGGSILFISRVHRKSVVIQPDITLISRPTEVFYLFLRGFGWIRLRVITDKFDVGVI